MNRKPLFPAVLLAILLTGCTYAAPTNGYIGLETARQIALEEAGLTDNDVRWERKFFHIDDGTPVYELEFRTDGTEYKVDIHAVTGKVLDYDAERND